MTAGPSGSYRRLLAFAGAALVWEQVWPRLWPFAALAGLFLALALLDVLPGLPWWLHLGLLVLFAAAAAAALVHAARDLRLPDRAARRRRLERDSALAHRPLTAMEDRLAAGDDDPLARSLWVLHQQRLAATATRLAVRPPSPGVPGIEPWGLRAGVVLLLVIGVAAAGGDGAERLRRALSPALPLAPPAVASIEVWITPPAYTGWAPLRLAHRQGDPSATAAADGAGAGAGREVRAPAGSTLLAQVSGVGRNPRLIVGGDEVALAPLDTAADTAADRARAFRAEATLRGGERLAVAAGLSTLAEWPLTVVADAPPSAAFAKPPEPAGNGALRLAYTATDDYGVRALAAEIRRQGGPASAGGEAAETDDVVRLDLALPAAAEGKELAAGAMVDLAEHAWAGQPTRLRLVARDAADQVGSSEELHVVLPERSFRHPVAQAIIVHRKRLAGAVPAGVRADVAAALAELGRRPDAFDRDLVVSLALAIAGARLRADHDGVDSVRALLWATALALDEGDVPRAERALAQARENLRQALAGNAEEAEVERLADALDQALAQYLDAMAEELARWGGAVSPPIPADAVLGSDELRDLVDMVRQMARTGARDGARELLDQLQAMLDGLRNGLDAAGDAEAMAEAAALMQALRDLASQQQALLDQTFAKLREAGNAPADLRPKAPPDKRGAAAAAGAQAELRRQLGGVSERLQSFLGAVPGALQAADKAMNTAAQALRQGDLEAASGAQGQALQALRDAQQGAGQAMGKRLGGGMALFRASGQGGDIFGRSPGGGRGIGIGEVEIPDGSELRRAGEILEELRRRAGERSRPEAELDYIERLLRRF